MSSVETLNTSVATPLKKLDILIEPDPGGRFEGSFNINDTIVFAKPLDRISYIPEPQRIEVSPFLPEQSPLEKAGFLLHRQMVNFIEGVNNQSLAASLSELIGNIRGHANEYTRERPLLIGNVKRTADGVVNKYNDEPVINHLDWQEREGATARGNLELEKRVLEAGKGESVVQISPSGWNGLYPDYEKAQFIYFRLKDEDTGELEQLTFVVNYSVEKCLDILEAMGVSRADLVCVDNKETIKKIVGQVVTINSTPKDFFNLIKSNSKNPNEPTLAIIERDLARLEQGEDISVLPPVCEDYIESLEKFILENADKLSNPAFQAEVSDTIEETIYKIAQYIRGKVIPSLPPSLQGASLRATWQSSQFMVVEDSSLTTRNDNWRNEYLVVIEQLKEISGCAGGGNRTGSQLVRTMSGNFSVVSVVSSSSRFITSEGSNDYHTGDCVSCKRASVLVGECDICTSCEQNMS